MSVKRLVVGQLDLAALGQGMQGVMPVTVRSARKRLLSEPRSAMSSRAGGGASKSRQTPLWSLICPSVSNRSTGWPYLGRFKFVDPELIGQRGLIGRTSAALLCATIGLRGACGMLAVVDAWASGVQGFTA
jgi:hypothetical protein